MQLAAFALGPLATNSLLVHDQKEAVAIDVGGEPSEMLSYLREQKLTLSTILITHLHFDHIMGAAALQQATQAKLYCSDLDIPLLEWQQRNRDCPTIPPFEHSSLDEGVIELLGASCTVLLTPGHTKGSLSFYFKELESVFCGDVLFYRSVGRTDLPGGDTNALMQSIRNKLYTLPDATMVYPGHGQETSIAEEKHSNPFVRG